jgi:DNA-binding NarL/FixJ family response regulator
MAKILVIEDDKTCLYLQMKQLELDGHKVLGALSGQDGLEKVRSFKPDLVICDIIMPEMNGYEVLARLRARPETADLPFIFLTGRSRMEDLREGMDRGADDYLVKPFTGAELRSAVQARLQRHRLVRQQSQRAWEERPAAENVERLTHLGLTNREAEVLFWVMQGKTNPEIATILGLSRATVRTHLQNVFPKLGVETRHAATLMALKALAEKSSN